MNDYYDLTYQEKDDSGRTTATRILQDNFVIDNTYYPENPYTHYDMTFDLVQTYRTTSYIAEIKLRPEYSSTAFDSIMLEKEKYDAIHSIPEAQDKRIVYMMVWNDGVMDILNINNEPNVPLTRMYLPKNNVDKNEKKYKDVWNVPISQCTRLKLKS